MPSLRWSAPSAWSVLGFAGFAVVVAACTGGVAGSYTSPYPNGPGSSPEGTPVSSTHPLEALVPLPDCPAVEGYLHDRLIADVVRDIDARIANIEKSNSTCYYYGGGSTSSSSSGGTMPAPAPESPSAGSSGTSGSGAGGAASDSSGSKSETASSTSSTNNQVATVDEADFVKNDNKYLYVVDNGALRVVEAWPPESARTIAKVPFVGTPKKLFVDGDRALIYVSIPKPAGTPAPYRAVRKECTYGYDCVPAGDGTATKVLVFDIKNREQPYLLRDITLTGSLLAARRIGDAVHTVVVDAPPALPDLETYPKDLRCDAQMDAAAWKEKQLTAWRALRERNIERARKADVLAMLPGMHDGATPLPACGGYFRPNIAEGRTLTTVMSVDMKNDGPAHTATVVSDPGVVYASETGLYMSVARTRDPQLPWAYPGLAQEQQASTVHKFRIGATPALLGYEASGVVKGRVLNQFALDEHAGHLRVATTTGKAPAATTHSTMSVLKQDGKSLVITGKVDQIAPTEDIRSVRFDGSRGFVVTFKKTDPLYAFDLGDPTKPAIAGELKIPGFSTYMHMMDARHLLTIGYDAADQGNFAYFQGVLLQIFDVSDLSNPTLAHKEVIGTRGSSSEALTNHLAFNYFAPKNLLALPMTVCEGGTTSSMYGTTMTFSGLMVFDVTTAAGFAKRGEIAHPNATTGLSYDNVGCSNWWTNARSEVKRSVIMDDFVYSISNRRVKINHLGNLSVDVREIPLDL